MGIAGLKTLLGTLSKDRSVSKKQITKSTRAYNNKIWRQSHWFHKKENKLNTIVLLKQTLLPNWGKSSMVKGSLLFQRWYVIIITCGLVIWKSLIQFVITARKSYSNKSFSPSPAFLLLLEARECLKLSGSPKSKIQKISPNRENYCHVTLPPVVSVLSQ